MDIFFNELSLSSLPDNEFDAKKALENLFVLFNELKKQGGGDFKMSSKLISEWKIESSGYNFTTWLHDSEIDSDLRGLALTQTTIQPTFEEIYISKTDGTPIYEYEYENQNCFGLGLASSEVSDTICIGISANDWHDGVYTIKIISADEHDISETFSECLYLTKIPFGEDLKEKINTKVKYNETLPQSGKAIISSWNFSNLSLSDKGKEALKKYKNGSIEINAIYKNFSKLNHDCSKWDGKILNNSFFSTKISPESSSRINQCPDLIFIDDSGSNIQMNWHARFTPGPGRLYFRQKENKPELWIDYVGTKLCLNL